VTGRAQPSGERLADIPIVFHEEDAQHFLRSTWRGRFEQVERVAPLPIGDAVTVRERLRRAHRFARRASAGARGVLRSPAVRAIVRFGPRYVVALALVVASMTVTRRALGDDADDRPPLPEPIFTESVTDLDAHEDQELELEANFAHYGARRGGASLSFGSLEIEYRATRWLGLLVEPGVDRSVDLGGGNPRWRGGASMGGALGLFHDFAHDLHLQLEVVGRVPATEDTGAIGDPVLPLAVDLRGGARFGRLTVRPGIGVEAGGHAEYAPFRASVALLTPVADDARFGFVGVEVDVDAARRSPLILALNMVSDLTPLGLPFRFGVAIPWLVAADATRPSLGLYVRLFYVSERESEYGRAGARAGSREPPMSP